MEEDENINSSNMNNENDFKLMKNDSQMQNENNIERRESYNNNFFYCFIYIISN